MFNSILFFKSLPAVAEERSLKIFI
jgi:hypothetical protein